jgi:SAM-dependent methyltransferase
LARHAEATPCRICGDHGREVLYRGPIRVGRFGQRSAEPRTVWRCTGCGVGHLPGPSVDYASGEYRALVDGSDSPEDFHRTHDPEQVERIRMLGTGGLRGAVLMDVGCGAGSFLDVVKGMCRATIGIEPTPSLRQAARAKGHEVFPYGHDVPPERSGTVDIAVAFSLVEHVDDPRSLLQDIHRLLRPGGRLLVSTPNRRDWLLEVLPDDYAQFFYRLVHTWYFDADALAALLRLAGFTEISVAYLHRFDLSNAILWLRDKRPTGLGKLEVAAAWSDSFRSMLEATGRADYLYGACVKP